MLYSFVSQIIRFRVLFAAFAFLICLLAAHSAQAQLTLTVTRTDDRNTACVTGVNCSLREAVNTANATTTNDTINFAIPAGDCTAGVCTITLGGTELVIANNGTLTINGTGANQLRVSGIMRTRVFHITAGANVTINALTIAGGNPGIGSLGGGIVDIGGTLTLTNSTVSGNSAGGGGGIYNDTGTLTLTNSTVSGNTAGSNGYGGGIYNFLGTLKVTNSTVSGNSAGGGIGGIYNVGTGTLKNSIIANSTGGDCSGITASYSLIEDGSCGVTNGVNGNKTGDPNLGALQNNGGPSFTHALLIGSIAIDAGSDALAVDAGGNALTTDQRGAGFPRKNGASVDMGAFEYAATTAANVTISGRVTTANGRGIVNVRLSLTDSQGNVRTANSTAFGYYRFNDVEAGQTYIITATGKRYIFNQSSKVLNVTDEITEINFTGVNDFK